MSETKASQLKPRLIVAAVIFLLGTMFFVPFLFSGPDTLLVAQDQVRGIPSWQLYGEYLRKGILPVWWGSQLGGSPVYESMPGDGIYPVSVFLMFFVSSIKRVGINMWLHTLLSGTSAYIFGRRQFGLGRFPSVLVSAFWMFNPYMFSLIYGGHIGKYYILSVLPFALLGLLRYMDTGKWRWAALLAGTLGWMIFSTHLQVVYFALWGFFLFWLASLWTLRKEPKVLATRAVGFWVAIFLGLGIGAPILYPAMGFVEKSTVRGTGGEKNTLEHASSWSLHWEDVPALVVPEFVGVDMEETNTYTYWGGNPFKTNTEAPGAVLLTLGIAGIAIAWGTRNAVAGAIGVLAILFGLGAHTPLLELAFKFIPGVSKFRAPSMILFWLAAGMMIGLGSLLQKLDSIEGRITPKQAKILLWAIAGIGGLGLLFALAPTSAFEFWTGIFPARKGQGQMGAMPWMVAVEGFRIGAIRVAIVVAGSLFALRQFMAGNLKKEILLSIWLVLGLVDLVAIDSPYIMTEIVDKAFPPSPAAEALSKVPGKFRILDMPAGSYPTGFHDFYHLDYAAGFSDIELAWYSKFRQSGIQIGLAGQGQAVWGSRLLDIMNVQFLLRRDSLGREMIFRNMSALPRVWTAPRWTFAKEDQVVPTILSAGFEHNSNVVLLSGDESKVAAKPSADTALKGREAKILEYLPGKISVQSETTVPSLLFLADCWYSAWSATVDGAPAPVLRADLAFRAVPVPAGSHVVEFKFHNPQVVRAWQLGALSLAALALLWAAAWKRKVW